MHESIIEFEVAKVFRILSANFIVAATIIPPEACGRVGEKPILILADIA